MINIEDIEKIMQVVDKFEVSHFEFQHEDSKIIIDKNKICEGLVGTNTFTKGEIKAAQSKIEKSINEDVEIEITEKEYIKAAFAGTFYCSKEKSEQAFVGVNDEVECDTVVGLIEVMKLFNEVEAGVQGTIVDILVKDGEFVEYGQPLFEIKSK
ncbi:acetyl-CoA carboxylase biotin carboxyl carrier protein [Clostridium beijerinckii]|uniref:Biotin carboxyl carrier protein of acetyl-CoA carboxylase n=1 Tax=Clostridium beijerinckii TaxID=1520 RepID=A0A0B5QQY3_CLOBE|nr:biotin/lipoyl-containing protein [Clostridium beijerinckii]AJG99293.1 acetyl-CoA carboxylase biotin carboxyl carrier protein subunit [Clostridium beijerinckii]AQS05484.1 biotin carboxyl carrier protein of acetyl-CoA carboxylase [Clostridium beijerinckii]MBA2885013.1 acetyl-CoA carboxylase biotin carboxyl carrier protein [Clostridium beijerinckii]MBA2899613.1 acetyl-CoA carboxylase biotin carboxyl carrier protein [Clostridium beijerinckii]MBA2909364.1 acetyl-CoA carboxylase biotin carboxyl c